MHYHRTILSSPSTPCQEPADAAQEAETLDALARVLHGFSSDRARPGHVRALARAAAVLLDRLGRLCRLDDGPAEWGIDSDSYIRDSLLTAVLTATHLRALMEEPSE